MTDQLIAFFSKIDWQGIVLVTLLTSLALSAMNRNEAMKRIHDGWLIAGVVLLTSTVMSFSGLDSVEGWQRIAFQFLSTTIISYTISKTKGQAIFDWFIDVVTSTIKAVSERVKKMLGAE